MSEHIDLTNTRLWSGAFSYNNDRVLLDPISRRPFNPNEVPQCIEEDVLLYAGVRSLIERGSAIRMKTAYTRHVAESEFWAARQRV